MRTLRTAALALITSLILSSLGWVLFITLLLDPVLKERLQTRAAASLGAPMRIGSLTTKLIPPITIEADAIAFSSPRHRLNGSIEHLSIHSDANLSRLFSKGPLGLIRIRITGLKLSMPRTLVTDPESTPLSFSKTKFSAPKLSRDLHLRLEITNGRLELIPTDEPKRVSPEAPGDISKLDFALETKSLAASLASREFQLITGENEVHGFRFENAAQFLAVLQKYQLFK